MTAQTPAAGATITGRCVTMGTTYTGIVIEMIEPQRFSGDSEPRYRIANTGRTYSNGQPIDPIVWLVELVEPAPALTLTDADGVTFHASDEYGTRLSAFDAARAGDDVRWRRQFRVTFPRYSRGDVIRAAVAAATLPHERVTNTTGDHWGGDDVTVTTELVFPSSSWCVECAQDVRPDRYGRTWPRAVSITPAGSHRSYTVRNYPHDAAHELADRHRAQGDTATVSIDACG